MACLMELSGISGSMNQDCLHTPQSKLTNEQLHSKERRECGFGCVGEGGWFFILLYSVLG